MVSVVTAGTASLTGEASDMTTSAFYTDARAGYSFTGEDSMTAWTAFFGVEAGLLAESVFYLFGAGAFGLVAGFLGAALPFEVDLLGASLLVALLDLPAEALVFLSVDLPPFLALSSLSLAAVAFFASGLAFDFSLEVVSVLPAFLAAAATFFSSAAFFFM
jgi:hypothetical protein